MPQMKAWTYSQLDGFETCARQYHARYVAKTVPYEQSEAAAWGDRVHKAFENFILQGEPLPQGMTQWTKLMTTLKSIPGEKLVEQKMGITRAWEAADYWQSWSRGKVDLTIINGSDAALLDYKTGKRKPSEQLQLYAAYTFANYPKVDTVQTGFAWLKDKKIDREQYHRDELPGILKEFAPRVHRLEVAFERDAWPARPSGLCKGWCPVKTCEHWKAK